MNSGVKFALYSLAAILFIGGLNSIVNREEAEEFILWLFPFLCLGTGIGIPVLILLYETYFSNDDLDSNDDNAVSINNEENSNTDNTDQVRWVERKRYPSRINHAVTRLYDQYKIKCFIR